MIDFSLAPLLDSQKCYQFLLHILHPYGLVCANGHSSEHHYKHKEDRESLPEFRCKLCGSCFNLFSGTVFQGTHYSIVQITQMLHGFIKGFSTAQLAREMCVDSENLLNWRHKIQELGFLNRVKGALDEDKVVEVDEVFQNAGEKGERHDDPEDPPRRRGNKVKGHGTWENDRVPIAGIVGRDSGELRVEVLHHTTKKELEPFVADHTVPETLVNSDEWGGYTDITDYELQHKTVNHGAKEYARDDDGDGKCEVHNNTIEGIWTGFRNFLRPFRGVNKKYLHQYLTIFEWAFNWKEATHQFWICFLNQFTLFPV